MKTLKFAALMLSLFVFGLTACKKADPDVARIQTTEAAGRSFTTVTAGFYYTDITVPNIPANEVGKSAVHVYAEGGSGLWWPLTTLLTSDNGREHTYYFRVEPLNVRVFAEGENSLPSSRNFRVVVVRPGLKNSSAKQVDFNNYQAVKEAFNLGDEEISVIE